MDNEILQDLLIQAKAAAEQAYAPYSGYRVGAAILTDDGTVFTGCNVENASYSLTICAERNAVFHAVSQGYRDFRAVAVYVDADVPFPPCGACRQVLSEFGAGMDVIYADHQNQVITSMDKLLPGAFSLKK